MKSLNLISLITQPNNQFIKTNFYKLATQLNLLKKQVFEWLLNILCIKIDKNNM